jgi:hypothetical protein
MFAGMKVYFWSPHPLKGRNRADPHRWRGPATVVSPDGGGRYFLSWRGKLLLTSVDQLRPATAEESAATAVIGEDAILTRDDVQAEEDKRYMDLTDAQPVPDPPARVVREAVFRQRQRMRALKDAEGRDRLVLRPNKVRFERKALADQRRALGLAVPGRKPRALEDKPKEQAEPMELQAPPAQPAQPVPPAPMVLEGPERKKKRDEQEFID